MSRKNDVCRRCLNRDACLGEGMKPSLGPCSLHPADRRQAALEKIAGILKRNSGSAGLRHRVKAEADYFGNGHAVDIFRISTLPGSGTGLLTFRVAEDVTTDQLDTETLEMILKEI